MMQNPILSALSAAVVSVWLHDLSRDRGTDADSAIRTVITDDVRAVG